LKLDPLGSLRRTHYCGEISPDAVGSEVVLCGWVETRRDLGGVIFVDLRDRTGIAQLVFKPDTAPAPHSAAQALRSEWVLAARGTLQRRSPDTVNPKLPTGELEIAVTEVAILNSATPPPFPLDAADHVDEAVRLKYRIHDLRRAPMQRRLALRHRLLQSLRATCTRLGLFEIETPILTRATPEGARDFLVPSRLQPGQLYALPQSPQLLKQLLMTAGYDRYFQIARCFRDEDLRADRQPEFTQLDLELSFVGEDDVLKVLEEITCAAFLDVLEVKLPRPFRRVPYREVMERYGSDKPDTRDLLELVDLSDILAKSGFRVFTDAVARGGVVYVLPVPQATELTRGDIDRLVAQAQAWGAKGLAYVRITEEGTWQSPIAKFLSEDDQRAIAARCNAGPGHLLLFGADRASLVCDILGRLRSQLSARLGRRDPRPWDAFFVVDFPLFEADENGKLTYMHMPFVAPHEDDLGMIRTEPQKVRATHYDLVINGAEIGSGSLRNHRADIQLEILSVLGYDEASARAKFGFLLDALEAGAPPHGGFAFGVDRLALHMAGGASLRDVIAFPKTQRGRDELMQAPSNVEPQQLAELGLRLSRAAGSGSTES
jgi:aspartyl-tRNA synthetase